MMDHGTIDCWSVWMKEVRIEPPSGTWWTCCSYGGIRAGGDVVTPNDAYDLEEFTKLPHASVMREYWSN